VYAILVVYVLVNSHLVLDLHFCGGDLVSWSWTGHVDKCCSSSCTKGCCQDLEVAFGNADDHVLSDFWLSSSLNLFEIPAVLDHPSNHGVIVVEQCDVTFISHPPPNPGSRKIYLVCEQFLI
jgi:hypothetical protein